MKAALIASLFLSIILCVQAKTTKDIVSCGRGFYKDVFMESGINLSSRRELPAARFLNLQLECFVGEAFRTDTILQNAAIGGTPEDENGILLYPDGAPRFRMIYTNGGIAEPHGRTLSDISLQHIRDYINAGGSYLGSCAGAYLASLGHHEPYLDRDTIYYRPHYYRIWPGITQCAEIYGKRHDVIFEKDSPLKKYYDFGEDNKVDSVYHYGGCYADQDTLWPRNTEILARFGTRHFKTKKQVDGKPVIWAYKASAETGRVIPCGSHPEPVTEGERLLLMASMMRYAMDGNGVPRIKANLELDKERKMTASTHGNNPAFTKIGDKQYHHFTVDVPEGQDSLVIQLKSIPGYTNYDMNLFLDPQKMAWKEDAQYQNFSLGFDKSIAIDKPKAGRYYISVYCATTVDTMDTLNGTQYYGRTDVLNGVPYIIQASCPKLQKTK